MATGMALALTVTCGAFAIAPVAEKISAGGCPTCAGSILVDQSVLANFNTNPPSCSGDADLCAFFTFNNSGPTADTWFAIFDIGPRALLVNNGATITTSPIGSGNNQSAPGIRIRTTCSVEVQPGGAIVVQSLNRQAGDILIQSDGPVTVNGTVSNSVEGTNGLPGDVTIATCCGGITTGPGSLIQTVGNGPGGSDITLLACCQQGDISLSGLVMARAKGSGSGPKPNVRIASFSGSVTVHADSAEPQLDEFTVAGTRYDVFPGVLSWVYQDSRPGSVLIQASGEVRVFGHGDDATPPARQSFAAVAAGPGTSDATGGLVDVRSIHGLVAGTNRAFQSFGRYHTAAAASRVRLFAGTNIELSRPGGNAAFNPVVDSLASPSAGSGGTNELRAFGGNILIDGNALVSGTGATPGSNLLTSCLGVNKLGTVDPADPNAGDDSGVCAPEAAPLFADCAGFGITFPPNPSHGPAAILFLNRFGGTYRAGPNSAAANTSSIITGTRTVPPFAGTDADWASILGCMRAEYAPFNVSIVDVEPAPTVRYTEAVVGGLPGNIGYPPGVAGVAPQYCSPATNTIVFILSAVVPGENRLICEFTAHETGHSFALDHEFLCEDPMTYLTGCGEKTFQDQTVACGEFSERTCACGNPTQNSFANLLAAVGPNLGPAGALRPPPLESAEPSGVCVLPLHDRR